MEFSFKPIGVLSTCFKEKFGIPRQPGLASGADGILKLNDDPLMRTAVRALEGFSHIWVIFVFHRHDARNWKPSIRPPRLGGARKVGVLASRSPHRPNPIGMSAVKLERIDLEATDGIELHLSGLDILDGTPVIDLKPYLPYADAIPGATSGWAEAPIDRIPVEFTARAEEALGALGTHGRTPPLRDLITQMLELDPRPAFQKRKLGARAPEAEGTRYGFRLLDWDVRWQIREGRFHVLDVVEWSESS